MEKSKDKNYKARKPGKRKSRKYATVQIRGGGSYRRRNANKYGEVEGGEEYTETRKNRSDNDLRKMYDKGGKIQSIESEIEEYELVVNDDSVPSDEREFAKAEIADLKEQLKQLKSEDTDTSKAEAKVEDIKAEVANIEADIAKEEGDTKKAKSKEKEADKAENKAKQIRKTKKSTKTKSQVKEAQEKVAKDIQKAKKRLEQRKSDVRSGKGKKTRRSEFMKRLNALVKKHKSLKAQIIGRPEENLKRDEGRLAKPVGYRFKGKRTRKPTADEVKKGIRNKTVYYEGRVDRSDRLKSVRLAKGGRVSENIKTSPKNIHKIGWGSIITFKYHGEPRVGKILESSISDLHLNNKVKISVFSLISSSRVNILHDDIICRGEQEGAKYF